MAFRLMFDFLHDKFVNRFLNNVDFLPRKLAYNSFSVSKIRFIHVCHSVKIDMKHRARFSPFLFQLPLVHYNTKNYWLCVSIYDESCCTLMMI